MTRWVEVIHFEIDHREVRTVVPVDLTEEALAECISMGVSFIAIKANPDELSEVTFVLADRIVAYRTVTERPNPSTQAPSIIAPDGSDPTNPGTWIG